MRALARRHGAHHVRPPRVGESPVRELVAIAVENAIEGCVRETWGAALAWFQATHAADPIVRSAMARIARDETQHAALGWSLHHWAMTRLPAAQRAEVARALEGARAALPLAVATVPDQDIRHRLGLLGRHPGRRARTCRRVRPLSRRPDGHVRRAQRRMRITKTSNEPELVCPGSVPIVEPTTRTLPEASTAMPSTES